MIKCVLIEDDPNDMKLVKAALDSVFRKKAIPYTLKTSPTAVGILPEPFTLYILDIDLPEMSGLKFAKIIQSYQSSSAIAFCSANKDFVWNSQPLNSFYFIRKDSLSRDIERAVDKYLRNYTQAADEDYFSAVHEDKKIQIPWKNICFIQAENCRVVVFCLYEDKPYSSPVRFKQVIEKAKMHKFLRMGRSHLINTMWIDCLMKEAVAMKDGKQIPAGRISLANFRKDYMEFLSRELI